MSVLTKPLTVKSSDGGSRVRRVGSAEHLAAVRRSNRQRRLSYRQRRRRVANYVVAQARSGRTANRDRIGRTRRHERRCRCRSRAAQRDAPTVSLFFRPVTEKSVEGGVVSNVYVTPYTLLTLFAATVNDA